MNYIIPIHGIIGSPESKNDRNQYFTYSDFLLHLNKAKRADTLTLDIASDGGYCDIADRMISELQKTGKTIASFNSGNVCSAASKMFTMAEKNLRVYYPTRGAFLIHNPWSTTEGDATDHLEMAAALKQVESDYINWYVAATGVDEIIISQLMAENIPLTEKQVEEFGFATVIQPTVQAFAKLKSKNMKQNKTVLHKISRIEKMIKTISDKFSPKALMIADVSGNELDFADLTDVSEIAEGVKVTIDGEAVTGDYVLVDGSILTIENGVVTVITPASEQTSDEPVALSEEEVTALQAENEALKIENEELKAQVAQLTADLIEMTTKLQEVNEEVKGVKALASGFKPSNNRPEVTNKPKKFSYKRK